MAASRSFTTPWSIFKRLKIQPAQQSFLPPRAHISSSSSASDADPKPTKAEITAVAEAEPEAARGGQLHERMRSTNPGAALSVSPQDAIRASLIELANERNIPLPPIMQDHKANPRLPRSVQALYFNPLRRTPTHGIPVANLQLRSFSVRNLEFMADFALRAAYYLNLPARGPVALPKITQRWTVPRDTFIFKKSQENWERVTCRRLIQIQDGHPDVVRRWLQFVKRHCWYGVGMKADVFEWEDENVVQRMDASGEVERLALEKVDWELFGRRKGLEGVDEVGKALGERGFAVTTTAGAKADAPAQPTVQ